MNNCFLAPFCCALMSQVTYMGHVVSDVGIQTRPEKLEALKSFPVSKNVKEVGIFLGFTGYYRRFVKNYVCIAKTLHDLLGRALVYCEILGRSIFSVSNRSWLPFSQFVIALFSIRDCLFLHSWLPFSQFVIVFFWQISCILRIELPHYKTNKMTCVPSKDTDQPGHPFSDNVTLIKLMICLNAFLS